jgi:hypothetical protein
MRYLTSGRAYVQDERYFAKEHMDVRREASRGPHMRLECPGKTILPPQLQPDPSASIRNHNPMITHRAVGWVTCYPPMVLTPDDGPVRNGLRTLRSLVYPPTVFLSETITS